MRIASGGYSNKHIAYELGLCSSTVAALLTSAMRKLGVTSRETLLHAFAALGGSAPHDREIRVREFRRDGRDWASIRIEIAPRLPPSLTAAEAKVAAFAIAGLSNAEIAERRNTSVRTVANQLRSIYAKLEVGSRRQLCSRFSLQRSLGSSAMLDVGDEPPSGLHGRVE